MSYIIEFYKGLDTINLIIFWGVIIVVLLMLIFSIIIANKNRKLERIIESRGIKVDEEDTYDDLAIKKTEDVPLINKKIEKPSPRENTIIHEEVTSPKSIINDEPREEEINIPIKKAETPIKEEKFVAEEHVKEYNNDFFVMPEIKRQEEPKKVIEEVKEPVIHEIEKQPVRESESTISKTTAAYQRNILREVYPSQTSPIGSVRRNVQINKEIDDAKELNKTLNSEKNNYTEEIYREQVETRVNHLENKPVIDNRSRYQNHISTYPEVQRKGNYLEELSKKMSANNADDLNRTSYELQQEENAIISYKELLQKRDNIKTIDEEDAIISIEELKRREQQREKLYNITEKEPNDDFINELKNFRSDL